MSSKKVQQMTKDMRMELEHLRSRDVVTVSSLGFIPEDWSENRKKQVAHLFDKNGKVDKNLVMTVRDGRVVLVHPSEIPGYKAPNPPLFSEMYK